MLMSAADLSEHLQAIAEGFEEGDTWEGSISFHLADESHGPDLWEVEGAYRVNNRNGQGGMVLIQASEPDAES